MEEEGIDTGVFFNIGDIENYKWFFDNLDLIKSLPDVYQKDINMILCSYLEIGTKRIFVEDVLSKYDEEYTKNKVT